MVVLTGRANTPDPRFAFTRLKVALASDCLLSSMSKAWLSCSTSCFGTKAGVGIGSIRIGGKFCTGGSVLTEAAFIDIDGRALQPSNDANMNTEIDIFILNCGVGSLCFL